MMAQNILVWIEISFPFVVIYFEITENVAAAAVHRAYF